MQGSYMQDLDSWYGTPQIANPYDQLNNPYGTPNYGGTYAGHLSGQQQPLPLSRLVSMVRDIQQGMQQVPIGNQSVPMAPTTQMQMPGEIADNMIEMHKQRLLSQARDAMARQGMNNLDPNAQPSGGRYSTFDPGPTLIEAPRPVYQPPSGGGGGGGGGGINYAQNAPQGSQLTPSTFGSQPTGGGGGGSITPSKPAQTWSPTSNTKGPTFTPSGSKATATGKKAAGLHW